MLRRDAIRQYREDAGRRERQRDGRHAAKERHVEARLQTAIVE